MPLCKQTLRTIREILTETEEKLSKRSTRTFWCNQKIFKSKNKLKAEALRFEENKVSNWC